MSYLHLPDYLAWRACPGRPALEDSEGGRSDSAPTVNKDELAARKTALEALGATIEVLPLSVLQVGQITGERGALGWASCLLAQFKTGSTRLEVYPADKILGLAALVKFSILHQITETNVGSPDELYAFGEEVTEAAALSLSLKNSITALDHLVVGDYCKSCLAAYRCPKLKAAVHKEVFGPLQAPDEPGLVPVSLRARLGDGEAMAQVLARTVAQLPMIEGWCAAVRAQAGLVKVKSKRGSTRAPKRGKRRAGTAAP